MPKGKKKKTEDVDFVDPTSLTREKLVDFVVKVNELYERTKSEREVLKSELRQIEEQWEETRERLRLCREGAQGVKAQLLDVGLSNDVITQTNAQETLHAVYSLGEAKRKLMIDGSKRSTDLRESVAGVEHRFGSDVLDLKWGILEEGESARVAKRQADLDFAKKRSDLKASEQVKESHLDERIKYWTEVKLKNLLNGFEKEKARLLVEKERLVGEKEKSQDQDRKVIRDVFEVISAQNFGVIRTLVEKLDLLNLHDISTNKEYNLILKKNKKIKESIKINKQTSSNIFKGIIPGKEEVTRYERKKNCYTEKLVEYEHSLFEKEEVMNSYYEGTKRLMLLSKSVRERYVDIKLSLQQTKHIGKALLNIVHLIVLKRLNLLGLTKEEIKAKPGGTPRGGRGPTPHMDCLGDNFKARMAEYTFDVPDTKRVIAVLEKLIKVVQQPDGGSPETNNIMIHQEVIEKLVEEEEEKKEKAEREGTAVSPIVRAAMLLFDEISTLKLDWEEYSEALSDVISLYDRKLQLLDNRGVWGLRSVGDPSLVV